ncbi:hypothetical protein LYNGBM3L_72870 [Moorena producens 3L]|uniref:Uncharacterized protein n=1 Tax=Moorena producens 3L TaxID=489825 RepID=F4Y3Q2_9CYAN|nr:hypothetical protein LYNGBM3L_72870 [Moorena producens 3L]
MIYTNQDLGNHSTCRVGLVDSTSCVARLAILTKIYITRDLR